MSFLNKSPYYKNTTIASEAKLGKFLTWQKEDFCKGRLGLILRGHLLAQILLCSHTEVYSLSTLGYLTTFECVFPFSWNPCLFTHQTQVTQLMPFFLHSSSSLILAWVISGAFWNVLEHSMIGSISTDLSTWVTRSQGHAYGWCVE